MRIARASSTRIAVLAVTGGLALGVSATAWAVAASGGGDEGRRAAQVEPRIAGQAKSSCAMGYDTQSATNIPPDDSTSDNPPAATATMTKPCAGAVIGTLSTEVSAPAASDFLHIDMRATCTGGGGFKSHCIVGEKVFAAPGHSFLQAGPASFHVTSISMAWTGLRKGVWKFEVLPGGNNIANLQFRTFQVVGFNGG